MWKAVITTTVVYFLYVFLGGGIFYVLELVNLFDVRTLATLNTSVIVNFTELRNILLESGYTKKDINEIIKIWKPESAKEFFKVNPKIFEERSWTYANAFLFAFHLCTTIGYGDVSPKTDYAQMLACVYASIGIPLNILFFKLLGESFARSYQETIWRIKGDEDSKKKRMLADFGFFLPWSLILVLLPSIVFMFTENWNLAESIYYSFITLTTVGLGDYVAGSNVTNSVYYTLYKLILLCWMIYGLAFTTMIVDYLTHLYQIHLLFEFNCKWQKCSLSFKRTYIDIEKLDVHFRLLRSKGAKNKYSIWTVRRDVILSHNFHSRHLANLAFLAEKMQGLILALLEKYDLERDSSSKVVSKDAFPDKVPKDAFPVKVPKDAFPVKRQRSDDSTDESKNV